MKNILNFSLFTFTFSLVFCAVADGAKHIDVSSYFVSTNYLNCLAERTEKPLYQGGVIYATSGQTLDLSKPCAGGFPFGDGLTNLHARISAMSPVGINKVLLSSFVQVWDLPEADAIRVARESNNDIARAMKAYPDHFEGAALLPIVAGSDTCVTEAIEELERCVNEFGFKVWIAASNFGSDHLYDAKFESLLERSEQLGVAIYLQDAYPIEEPFAALDGKDDPNEWGLALNNGQDLMVTAMLMVMNGTFDRYPTLRIVLPNLGEYLPFNMDRMSFMLSNFDDLENLPCEQTLFHYAVTNKNFILTTSGTTNEIPFACAKRVMGAGGLCFGSGWPFDNMKAQADAIAAFDLTDDERGDVWQDNAEKYIFGTYEMIPSQPTPVANATATVYTDGVLSSDGMVWSNLLAYVVYTANDGYFFKDGMTVVSNRLDTTVNPAVNAAGEVVPASAEEPKLQLGIVAQRYPWNGTVDIEYKATFWPAGKGAAVEMKIGSSVTTNKFEVAGQGEVIGTISVTLPAEKKGKAQFRSLSH